MIFEKILTVRLNAFIGCGTLVFEEHMDNFSFHLFFEEDFEDLKRNRPLIKQILVVGRDPRIKNANMHEKGNQVL